MSDREVAGNTNDIPRLTDLTTALAKFLNGNTCVKCAFVIPTYEIQQSAASPANKRELAELVSRNKAQPFHSKIFLHNQFATNFSRLTHTTTTQQHKTTFTNMGSRNP